MTLTITAPLTILRAPSFPRRVMSDPLLREIATEVAPYAVRAAERLAQLISSARHVAPLPSDDALAEEVRAALEHGQDVPTDLLSRYAAVSNAQDIAARATRDLTAVAQELVNERDEELQRRSDAMLTALHDRLSVLMASLPSDIGSIPATADEAIRRGKGDEYSKLLDARDRYADIRAAQTAIVGAMWSIDITANPLGWPLTLLYLSNPDDGYPAIYEHHTTGFIRNEHGAPVSDLPWPDLRTADGLLWFAQHADARPWVPTRDQYREAEDKHEAARRAWIEEQPQEPARPGYPGGSKPLGLWGPG